MVTLATPYSVYNSEKYNMEHLKELLSPKTVNKFSYMANACWIGLGIILSSIFLDMEMNESRSDFRCGANDDSDLIQGKCFEQYGKQYNKLGIPVYGFVIFNFFVTTITVGIYSQYVKSRVEELEIRNTDVERAAQQRNPTQRKLFKAYCCQLTTRFFLGILFIILQTEVLYITNFPSNFQCSLKTDGNILNVTTMNHAFGNITRTQTYECHNQRANKKTFWTNAVIVVTGFFAFLVFIEAVWILSRVRKRKTFMEDSQFFVDHLKFINFHQRLQDWIKASKETVIKGTERLSDFASPFRSHHGEEDEPPKDVTLDQIYTNLTIHPGRANYDFTGDREKQLKEYPKPNANLPPTQPEDIIDTQNKNILLVGRPGIGKTIFCTKLLRKWASDSVFNQAQNSQLYFEAAFFVKFRRFNSATDLNLCELLAQSEFFTPLDRFVLNYILENPSKILLIFDGIDEFNAKEKLAKGDSGFKNDVRAKMPLHALYNKVATGQLLGGSTVLTTTRSTAVSCVKHLPFDRTVEILGFTLPQVEDFVNKFTEDEQTAARKTIWRHISSNLNIFSLCYVPVNCFIICMCLLHILKRPKSNSSYSSESLPTKLTDIYSIAIKIIVSKHNDKYRYSELTGNSNITFKSFNEFPEDVKEDFKRLGKIAFKGIEEGRLIFLPDEVKNLEDCGLLHRLPDLKASSQRPLQSPQAQFCFMHLTIQEFFAAKHITDTMDGVELREFLHGHIQEGKWQMAMQFVSGLLNDQETSSTDIFTDLLPVSTFKIREYELIDMCDSIRDSASRTMTCWPAKEDKPLALTLCNCLHESYAKDSTLQIKLIKVGFDAVDFSHCLVGSVECAALVNLLQNQKVLCLNLKENNIGSLGCIEICQNFDKLSSLNLSANEIPHEGVKHLISALTQKKFELTNLNLSFNALSPEAVIDLAKVLKHRYCKLSSLNLGGNTITHEAVKVLVAVLTDCDCKLSSLNLMRSIITPKDVTLLSEALAHRNCKLRILNLKGNGITDKDVKPLVKVLTDSNCKLRKLNLSNNYITHVSIELLANALTNGNSKLRSLNLDNILLNSDSVKLLLGAIKHKNFKLTSLNFRCEQITRKEKELLKVACKYRNCELKI